MSLTPISHQNSFSMIHKSRVPESARRGRLFEAAITRLAEWWSSTFKIEYTGHIRSRTFEEVQRELQKDVKGKGKAEVIDEDEDEVEVIRSEKSLMKHALLRRGSRDTSAQLFTALCRALGIPARLVVSLQSVPWQAGVGKPKPTTKKKVKTKGKGKAKASTPVEESNDEHDESDMEEVDISGVSTPSVVNKGKGKASSLPSGSNTPSPTNKGKRKAPPVIKLRGSTTKKSSSKPKETLPQGTLTCYTLGQNRSTLFGLE